MSSEQPNRDGTSSSMTPSNDINSMSTAEMTTTTEDNKAHITMSENAASNDIATNEMGKHAIPISDSAITAICNVNKDTLAMGTKKGSVMICSKDTFNNKEIGKHNSEIHCLDVFQDCVVSSSHAGSIKLWNMQSGERIRRIKPTGSSGPILNFTIEGEAIYFATHCRSSPIYKYSLTSGELLQCSLIKRKHIKCVQIVTYNDEKMILISSPKGLEIISMEKEECIPVLTSIKSKLSCCDDDMIGAIVKDKNLKVWHFAELTLNDLQLIRMFPISMNQVFTNKIFGSKRTKVHFKKSVHSNVRNGRLITTLSSCDLYWAICVGNGILIIDKNDVSRPLFYATSACSSILIVDDMAYVGTNDGQIEILPIVLNRFAKEEEDSEVCYL